MADITTSGQPAVERNLRLRQRKIQIQMFRLQAQVIEAENEIEAKQATLNETLAQLAERQKEFDQVNKEIGNG
jgi:peptidoglycan hydrolase CwlO-like protein